MIMVGFECQSLKSQTTSKTNGRVTRPFSLLEVIKWKEMILMS